MQKERILVFGRFSFFAHLSQTDLFSHETHRSAVVLVDLRVILQFCVKWHLYEQILRRQILI